MTDPKPAKATPAKPAAAKAVPAKAAAAKTPATKAPAKAAATKTPAAKTAAAKTPAAKTTVAKARVAKTTAAKTTAAKAAPATRAKTPAKAPAAASVAPAVPVVAPPIPVAAAAPAGWYQVTPGLAQQRYWDGAAWTEHLHDPATVQALVAAQSPAAHHAHLTAPEGTNPNTVWIWLTIASLVIGIAASLFQLPVITGNYTSASGVADSSVPFLVSTLLSLVELVAYVVFAVLDWRALGKRGVPRPFHWAWSLFAIILSSPIVYVIGRTVVVKRRTGKGLAPLWVFIALQVVTWIFGLIVLVVILTALATQFSNLLSDAGNVL